MIETYMMVRIAMMLTAICTTAALVGTGKWIVSKLHNGTKRIAAKPFTPAHTH